MNNFILIIITALLFVGCKENKQNVNAISEIYYIAIDNTGSYNFFEQAKSDLVEVLAKTPAGTKIFLRKITSDSYKSSNVVEVISIPENHSGTINPFSRKDKLQNNLTEKNIKAIKDQLENICKEMRSSETSRTDIDGFLLWVSERLDTTKRNVIIMLTDLGQNTEKYSSYLPRGALKEVAVNLVCFESTHPAIKKKWIYRFNFLGCASWKFYEPDEKISL